MNKVIIEIGFGEVPKIKIGNMLPLVFIGGPCAIENREHAMKIANEIKIICKRVGIDWICLTLCGNLVSCASCGYCAY